MDEVDTRAHAKYREMVKVCTRVSVGNDLWGQSGQNRGCDTRSGLIGPAGLKNLKPPMMQYLQWPLGRIGLNCQSSNQFLHYGRNSEMRADVREASLSYWLDLCQIVAAVRGFHVHLQICAAAGALENAFRVGATWNRQDCLSHTLIHSFRTHFTSWLLPHLFPSGACRSLSLSRRVFLRRR